MDDALKAAYELPLRAHLDPQGPAATMLEVMERERQARWDALTPEEQELETLRAKVRDLEHRLDHARRALDGHDCDEW